MQKDSNFLLAFLVFGFVTANAVSPAFASSCDADNGEVVFKKCVACHSLDENEMHGTGPNLHGVLGRLSGTAEDFKFSRALRDASITWDDSTLSEFLASPMRYVPRNRMAFSGLRKEQDRLDVICFMSKVSEN